MRIAYAFFGAITPVFSVVVSVFMLGLSLGSLLGGRWISGLERRYNISPLIFYALAELFIGLGAIAVPRIFSIGRHFLLSAGEMNSLKYLIFSGAIITAAVLPWCILMGATYPFMMSFLKRDGREAAFSFSYLYLANVAGAICGTLVTAMVLIELCGLSNCLFIAAALNLLIFFSAIVINYSYSLGNAVIKHCEINKDRADIVRDASIKSPVFIYSLLFFTGFSSMAMEVVWIRAFIPVLNTFVYSFAALLSVYLFATWVGSSLYRLQLLRGNVIANGYLLGCLSIFSFLPVVMNDPRVKMNTPFILASIFPFCAALGYLTPKLIDLHSSGRPSVAGRAYAVNISGCVFGPLLASYLLLPILGVRLSLIVLAVPFLVFFAICNKTGVFKNSLSVGMAVLSAFLFFSSVFISTGYEEMYASEKGSVVRRDYAATVISAGSGMDKKLLVNGIRMTTLTPITKMMAHLPLALCRNKPESALVICMGMGTTYRSALSWGIRATAVELVPGVKDAFGYYFSDAGAILENYKGRVIIDDGRRFLSRTTEEFDIITIDPPHPLEAASSSLLYSQEFYDIARARLKNGGILQQWFPEGEQKILQAIARSLSNSFPYVRVYRSVEGWGFHFFASTSPIDAPSALNLVSRMPAAARDDMMEWYKAKEPDKIIQYILDHEVPLWKILNNDKRIVVTDDRPYNEYYFLRRTIDRHKGVYREDTFFNKLL